MTVRKIHKNVFMEGFPGVSVVKNPSANARHTGLNPGPGGASGKKKKKKNPAANAGDIRDAGSIPGSGRSPGGGHSNPLQYSCLENTMDTGAW